MQTVSYVTSFFWLLIVIVLGSTMKVHSADDQSFKDRTVRIYVGFSPGGGFDVLTRAIARHMHKHIPGGPSVLVVNMPGAAGLVLANYMYNVAKPDGLSIGNFVGTQLLGQALGWPGIKFDARKFEYIGVPSSQTPACAMTRASGITNMSKWMNSKAPVVLGGIGRGSFADNTTKVVEVTLGLPIQLVTGYKGFPEIRAAMERGELAGTCHPWETLRATWPEGLESGDLVVVLQVAPKAHPNLGDVPLAVEFVKSDEARQLLQIGVTDAATITRVYTLPPGTPKERVKVLRRAFMDTMKDPSFILDAKRAGFDIAPTSGEEVERTVLGIFNLSPRVLAKLKEILE